MRLDSSLGEAAAEALAKLGVVLDREAVAAMVRDVKPNW
jgi:hypothetical protein